LSYKNPLKWHQSIENSEEHFNFVLFAYLAFGVPTFWFMMSEFSSKVEVVEKKEEGAQAG